LPSVDGIDVIDQEIDERHQVGHLAQANLGPAVRGVGGPAVEWPAGERRILRIDGLDT
jgi:hypothetical protein